MAWEGPGRDLGEWEEGPGRREGNSSPSAWKFSPPVTSYAGTHLLFVTIFLTTCWGTWAFFLPTGAYL